VGWSPPPQDRHPVAKTMSPSGLLMISQLDSVDGRPPGETRSANIRNTDWSLAVPQQQGSKSPDVRLELGRALVGFL